MNLLCIYAADTRQEVINELCYMRNQLEEDETELMELTDSTIYKLKKMTDGEFLTLQLYPDF